MTGSASGLGAALRRRLERDGQRVIGIDRTAGDGTDIVADLGEPAGREKAIATASEACEGALEGLVSCAALGPYEEAPAITRVNYFGAMAMLDGLR